MCEESESQSAMLEDSKQVGAIHKMMGRGRQGQMTQGLGSHGNILLYSKYMKSFEQDN